MKARRAGFDAQRAVLKAQAARNPVNAPNDQALDRLARCFGRPYVEAVAGHAS
ncbi:hypothetical protein [Rubrivivax gelatinosus]|uniref:hypothetical protein n=1 Tax=Rubrivivax gelatinosus TaxID=28068 RepID=UPI001907B931|nr:hypothetical protein [Rubrivivax gelatinosus]